MVVFVVRTYYYEKNDCTVEVKLFQLSSNFNDCNSINFDSVEIRQLASVLAQEVQAAWYCFVARIFTITSEPVR
jgi:hypothetical protein